MALEPIAAVVEQARQRFGAKAVITDATDVEPWLMQSVTADMGTGWLEPEVGSIQAARLPAGSAT